MAPHPEYVKLLHRMEALHTKKAEDYGSDADPFANIRASVEFGIEPWVAAMVRANDKMHRIQRAAQGHTLVNEGLEDSLIDLAAYSLIALVMLCEAND